MLSNAQQIADLAVEALKWEVRFPNKPGLVDPISNGAHQDMDVALFIKSAESLRPYFTQIVEATSGESVNQTLREHIGLLGRNAEQTMFKATSGVNTHKGAIWTFGLLLSGYGVSQNQITADWLNNAARLATLDDSKVHAKLTYGDQAKKLYGFGGAKQEAKRGFPHLKQLINRPLVNVEDWYRALMYLYATVDDTNILHRSNLHTLRSFQTQAGQILNNPRLIVSNPAFNTLDKYTTEKNISPGGSADLFAAAKLIKNLAAYREENYHYGEITLHVQSQSAN